MNIEMAADIVRIMLTNAFMLVAPMLITAIAVGVMISLFQSVTSIQEQTLTFVPKLVAIGIVILISANWMIRTMVEITASFIQRIPSMSP